MNEDEKLKSRESNLLYDTSCTLPQGTATSLFCAACRQMVIRSNLSKGSTELITSPIIITL